MYSRFQSRPDEGIRIPEHYSGCAFSPAPPTVEKKREESASGRPRSMEAARPTPPPSKNPPPPPPVPPLPPREQTEKIPPSPPANPVQGLFGDLGKAFPLSHGIGFDELLLLGLILLLAQSGKDQDTLLWLALLLFCG